MNDPAKKFLSLFFPDVLAEEIAVSEFCFYLLSEVGIGTNDNGDSYYVTPIGREEAEQIAYLMLINSSFFRISRWRQGSICRIHPALW